ncbi:hypothetical protein [Saccharibacillus sacchari]|uniref:Uncharacterized protein n=1 Tax=Saccharibacillus sacchari DSM 19268 TaxID=915437 RepID=A0A010Z7R6_9BACL|nr:hypothetical protein [Saccharibacillus sacchari]EXG83303.1 hypothetical protein SacsacDRAFT_0268 [Saccharibacillus sacchari DSM 19268]
MKKIIIGSVLTLAGTWIVGFIFIAAVLFVPNMSSWDGTRVWYAIFGGGPYEADLKQSMALGLPFAIGVLMFAAGIVILAIEFFRPESNRERMPSPVRPTPSQGNGGPKLPTFPADQPRAKEEDIPTMKEVQS